MRDGTNSPLTADAVNKIFLDCLYTEEETGGAMPTDFVKAEGVMNNFGFHPGRIESHREEVKALLNELPEQFQEAKGGGWSFLQACMTKDGVQWGEHVNIEQLFTLAIGLKLGGWCAPRAMWHGLPGGMPYFVVLAEVKP